MSYPVGWRGDAFARGLDQPLGSRRGIARLAEILDGLRGCLLLSLNVCPEVRETFATFAIEAVPVTYSVRAKYGGGAAHGDAPPHVLEAAWLHHAIKAANATAKGLLKAGVSPSAIALLRALMRPWHLFCADWITCLAVTANPWVVRIKLADLTHTAGRRAVPPAANWWCSGMG